MDLPPARGTHVCIATWWVPCPQPLPIPRGGTGDTCAGDSTAGTPCATSPAQHYRGCRVWGQGVQTLGGVTGSPTVSRGSELPGLAAPPTPCPCMPRQWPWHPKNHLAGSWIPDILATARPGAAPDGKMLVAPSGGSVASLRGAAGTVSSTVSRGAWAPAALGCHAVGMCQRSVPSRYLLL